MEFEIVDLSGEKPATTVRASYLNVLAFQDDDKDVEQEGLVVEFTDGEVKVGGAARLPEVIGIAYLRPGWAIRRKP